jgi:[ribosomal protein S5]-alanine N-acetyltransferase
VMEIETERLKLFPLSLEQLRSFIASPKELERELGFDVSREIVTDRLRRAIDLKIAKMDRADPTEHAWYTYWLIIMKDKPFGAGLAGFKGSPDPQGKAEIGYGIDSAFGSRGYMTEAVKRLIEWAFQDARCMAIVAPNTDKLNVASNRVLHKVGMRVYNETEQALDWRLDKE